MGIKKLRELKEESSKKIESKYVRYLIVGSDILSVKLLDEMQKLFGKSEVALLTSRELALGDMDLRGPTTLRGEKNVAAANAIYPNAFHLSGFESEYYKDQKFKPFSGRGKPEELLWGESFYIQAGAPTNLKELFALDDNQLKDLFADSLVGSIRSIKETSSDELLEKSNYEITLTNGSTLRTEYLIWGEAPHRFIFYYEDKGNLSTELVSFCEKSITPASLYVTFITPRKFDLQGTIFIPLSYTHPQGHYIGELTFENDSSRFEFLSFVDVEMCTEDEVSKKIRALRKALEKIFPEFQSSEVADFVSFIEQSPPLDFSEVNFPYDQLQFLSFLGVAAPVKEQGEVTHLARSLQSLKEIVEKFHQIKETIPS